MIFINPSYFGIHVLDLDTNNLFPLSMIVIVQLGKKRGRYCVRVQTALEKHHTTLIFLYIKFDELTGTSSHTGNLDQLSV